MKKTSLLLTIIAILTFTLTSCSDVTGGRSGGSAAITREAVEYYLAQEKLNSPGVAVEMTAAVNNGKEYRKAIKDENNKPTTLTGWIDRSERNLFCITYYRDMVCPKCHGTGLLTLPKKVQDAISSKISTTTIGINCPQCHGKGYLEKAKQKKCWILGVADYKDPAAAIAAEEANTLQSAPPNTKEYIDNLGSNDPALRLAACIWLDKNYIRPDLSLTEITPILDRARFVSPLKDDSLLRKIMGKAATQHEYTVYQFWAGKGDTALADKAYYRIYVDSTAGKVLRTTFVPAKSAKQRRR